MEKFKLLSLTYVLDLIRYNMKHKDKLTVTITRNKKDPRKFDLVIKSP